MKVLVIGATGVAGRKVIPRLMQSGFEVTAMVRSEKDIERFENIASNVIIGDILAKHSLDMALKNCDVVINLATAIPNWDQTDKIRNTGTKNLVEMAQRHKVKIIQQSIIFLYGDQADKIVDENTLIQPFPMIQSAANMEEIIMNAEVDYLILRGGTFYGTGTNMEDNLFELAKDKNLKVSNNKHSFNSLINVHDFAQACVDAVSSNVNKEIYNVVDDYNVSDQELYSYINKLFNNEETQSGGERFLPSLKCSNVKIKKDLGWEPSFKSYKSVIGV